MLFKVFKFSSRVWNVPVIRGSRVMFSSAQKDPDDGFVRSIHCRSQVKKINRGDTVLTINTGLVDDTKTSFSDQFITLMARLSYKSNFDTEAWLRRRIENTRRKNIARQIVSDEKIQHLGLDLAVAHMICRIGGRVKFSDSPKWYFQYASVDPLLPARYTGDHRLESIDLSGTNVVYEGLELLPQLTQLRHLRMRRCVHVDDFCMARVGRITTLELLDVSECPRLTSKGVASLAQLKNLRHLLIHNNPLMEDKELVCLLLEDSLPKLLVTGVDYLEALPEESRTKICALIADETGKDVKQLPSSPATENDQEEQIPRRSQL